MKKIMLNTFFLLLCTTLISQDNIWKGPTLKPEKELNRVAKYGDRGTIIEVDFFPKERIDLMIKLYSEPDEGIFLDSVVIRTDNLDIPITTIQIETEPRLFKVEEKIIERKFILVPQSPPPPFSFDASTSTQVNADGTITNTIQNGNTATQVNSNGTTSTTVQSGNTATQMNSDGTTSTTIQSGNTTTQVNSDGTTSTTIQSGNTATQMNSDGTTSTTIQSGNTATQMNSDGTTSTTVQSGNTTTQVNSDGTTSTTIHNGTNRTTNTSSSSSRKVYTEQELITSVSRDITRNYHQLQLTIDEEVIAYIQPSKTLSFKLFFSNQELELELKNYQVRLIKKKWEK